MISQEGKELFLVRGPILQILKVKKQVLTLRVRTGIIALNKEELLILITVQKNRNSLMTIKLRLTLLLIRSFSKAMKINKKKKKKKTSNVPGFNDFHKAVPGVKLSESTMEWWLRHRSRLIKKDKSEDKILSSIQKNLLQDIQPLLKLLNDTDDTNVKDTLSAGLAMLAAAIHRISKFRQSHYDEFSDISYESLKDKDPSVKPFYGDDYIQDIQSCTKSEKVTETAFSLSTKVKHNSKRNSTHKDHNSIRSYGYDSAHQRSRFRKQKGRGNFSNSRGSYSNSRDSHSHSGESRVES